MYDNKNNGNTKGLFMSAIMGAAVGASAVILSNKQSREWIKKRVNTLMQDFEEKKEFGKKKITDEVKKARSKLEKIQEG